MRRARFLVVPILLAGLMFSCTQLGIGTTDPSKMTPKQLATFFMGVYNRQYDDYKVQVAIPNLSDAQKKVLAQRKVILTQVYPLISAYDLAVASGQPTTKAQEQVIMALLNQLTSLLVK